MEFDVDAGLIIVWDWGLDYGVELVEWGREKSAIGDIEAADSEDATAGNAEDGVAADGEVGRGPGELNCERLLDGGGVGVDDSLQLDERRVFVVLDDVLHSGELGDGGAGGPGLGACEAVPLVLKRDDQTRSIGEGGDRRRVPRNRQSRDTSRSVRLKGMWRALAARRGKETTDFIGDKRDKGKEGIFHFLLVVFFC